MQSHVPNNHRPGEVELGKASHNAARYPEILRVAIERLDSKSESELQQLSQFPADAKAALSQSSPSLPVSSFPELFTKDALDTFRRRVTALVGDIDLQMAVARADIRNLRGDVHFNHPVHVFSSFTYKGQRMAGSFFGSVSNSILVFGTQFPNEVRQRFIEDLIVEFLDVAKLASVSIAFPQRMVTDPTTGKQTPAHTSAASQILTSKRLGFSSFNVLPDNNSEESSIAPVNQLFFFRGAEELLLDKPFLQILIAIRQVRSDQLQELANKPEHAEIQRTRDPIRRDVINALICPE